MAAQRRTDRDERRRKLGQNFLSDAAAEHIVAQADIQPDDLVLDIGAGGGAFTRALARRNARVLAVEADPVWAARLREAFARASNVRVAEGDFLAMRLPGAPFRVLGSPPFGRTTDILRKLLDDPGSGLTRADLVLQWEVAAKRARTPATSLLSAAWAPWWEMRLGERIPARAFRPAPRVDAALLTITPRAPAVLPPAMAPAFARFLREGWPFA